MDFFSVVVVNFNKHGVFLNSIENGFDMGETITISKDFLSLLYIH